MTATVPGAPPSPPPADDTPTQQLHLGAGAPPDQRGRVDVADQVVEKIAAGALDEVDGVGGTTGAVGRMFGRDDTGGRPRVEATVSGSAVRLDVRLSVAYPAPVAETCDRARERVVRTVGELTGLDVARVDITVTALTTPERSRTSTTRELA